MSKAFLPVEPVQKRFSYFAAPGMPKEDRRLQSIDIGIVAAEVCEVMAVTADELKNPVRTRRLVKARAMLAYIMVELMGSFKSKVGKWLQRDHSTVIYQVGQAKAFLEGPGEEDFKEEYEAVMKRLRSLNTVSDRNISELALKKKHG